MRPSWAARRRGCAEGGPRARSCWSAWPLRSRQPRGYGRCRMEILPDASAGSLHPFPHPPRRARRDGDHRRLDGLPRDHRARLCPMSGAASGPPAPPRGGPGQAAARVHPVASLAKRWLLGTHQGSVEDTHLQSYLNEFCFRFNRRRSRSRGLVFYRVLELAVSHDPVRYRNLVAHPRPKAKPPTAPARPGHPPSVERPRAARPWRTALPGIVRSAEYPKADYAEFGVMRTRRWMPWQAGEAGRVKAA